MPDSGQLPSTPAPGADLLVLAGDIGVAEVIVGTFLQVPFVAALEAFRQWRFRPGIARVTCPITFTDSGVRYAAK